MGNKIPKEFIKFCYEEITNVLRNSSLSQCHHADKLITQRLSSHGQRLCCHVERMYGGEDGSTKQDLMEYRDLLTNFVRGEEKGKEVLEAADDYSWDMLD